MQFIISPSKKALLLDLCFFLFTAPPCCLGLSQGLSGLMEDGKAPNTVPGPHPSPPPITDSKRGPSPRLEALLFMLRTGPPEASDNILRESQTNPHRATWLDHVQAQATVSSSSVRKNIYIYRKYNFPVDHQCPYRAYLDGP